MNKRPTDITVLSILLIIGGIGLIVISILMFMGSITSTFWGLIYPILAIFLFAIAYGLLKAKKWGRTLFLLLFIINVVGYIWTIINEAEIETQSIFPIVIWLIIIYYIFTRPHVKTYFEEGGK
jgi:hypothetical protein